MLEWAIQMIAKGLRRAVDLGDAPSNLALKPNSGDLTWIVFWSYRTNMSSSSCASPLLKHDCLWLAETTSQPRFFLDFTSRRSRSAIAEQLFRSAFSSSSVRWVRTSRVTSVLLLVYLFPVYSPNGKKERPRSL